ncbi:carboxymuconolactone decarboxylase family protein [Alteromonadaceae bacterium M269]|nr:carboxymuconolactone decarboxylase family protein [Alteromonadaceae bacterium M269]
MNNITAEDLLAEIRRALGLSFTPLIFKHFSSDINRLSMLWNDTRGNLLQGQLPRLLKDMIFVVVARSRNCHYCTTAHMAFCKMLGLNKSDLDLLVNDIDKLQPESVRLVLQFVVKLVDASSQSIQENKKSLLDAGMSEGDIDEIMLMAGFACHMTVLTKGLGLEKSADKEFEEILQA